MTLKLFITGTDTHVGKTYISVGLLNAFNQRGLRTLGIKPIASGCTLRDGQYVNEDALALQHASSIQLPYSHINPFALLSPIAPHLAAREQQIDLSLEKIMHSLHPALSHSADVCLFEGAGGLYVPLNKTETMADLILSLQCQTILVVGLRLGCINHALLTQHALQRQGISTLGWIANYIEPTMSCAEENINTLCDLLTFSCLGVVKHQSKVTLSSAFFSHLPLLGEQTLN